MVNKKRQMKNREGLVKGDPGKRKVQSKEQLFSEDSHQRSRVSQQPNEEKENVQDSGSRPRSGKMLRREPNSPVEFMMTSECMETFEKAGWLGYLQCLRGYHSEVALAFARSFDGHEATIGTVTLFVSEVSIAELGKLQLGGKRFTKKDKIDEKAANKFLRPEFHDPNWSKGIETRCLKKEYLPWLNAIKLYITCDGRYDHMFRYQVWFLMHLAGDIKINLPYFLLQSLTKMSKKIQKFPALVESSLIHQSLITMLVNDILGFHNLTFSEFLIESNFSPQSSSKKKNSEKGEGSRGVSRETDKEEMKKPAVMSEIGPNSKLEKPEVKITYTRRSPRTQKDECVKNNQETSEKISGKPFVRQRQTRPSNKFRLKAKMMMNPELKSHEVIILDSDQLPSEVQVDEPKKKRKAMLNDETVEKPQRVSVPRRKTKKKDKTKLSSGNKMLKRKLIFKKNELTSETVETLDHLEGTSDEVLPGHEKMQVVLSSVSKSASNDIPECSEKQDNLQKQKGKSVYIEDLAKEIEQIEAKEKVKTEEKNLKHKMQEWMALLAEEKGKGEDSKAAKIYGKLINMGHLAEELTWILETAVKTNVQAEFQDVKDSKGTKVKRVDHI